MTLINVHIKIFLYNINQCTHKKDSSITLINVYLKRFLHNINQRTHKKILL